MRLMRQELRVGILKTNLPPALRDDERRRPGAANSNLNLPYRLVDLTLGFQILVACQRADRLLDFCSRCEALRRRLLRSTRSSMGQLLTCVCAFWHSVRGSGSAHDLRSEPDQGRSRRRANQGLWRDVRDRVDHVDSVPGAVRRRSDRPPAAARPALRPPPSKSPHTPAENRDGVGD